MAHTWHGRRSVGTAPGAEMPSGLLLRLVGDRGFEPLTSSVSRKRSPPELIARSDLRFYAFDPLHTASTAHKVRSADDEREGVHGAGHGGECIGP